MADDVIPQPAQLTVNREPRAVVTKRGRRWNIVIEHGLMEFGPGMSGIVIGWTRWGRERAENKARKELARYRRSCVRPERFEVQH